mmetsp:Transcript_22174/g.29654  ORF Transcript_22174/g.29654 Transcript_22174/m.29654 type:complete len:316 (+) Transcript_22174:1519-2466(+)
MQTFVDTFKDYIANFKVLHASLSPQKNRDMVFKAGESAGRSGSFFFFSHDRKFIIKTMTNGELKLMLNMLPRLANHHQTVKQSLLAKIFGAFTVCMSKTAPVHIVLMENTMRLKRPSSLNYIFDLKGSFINRKTKGATTASTTLKDVNFLMAAKMNEDLTKQTAVNRVKLRDVIRCDVAFLRSEGLMDYSLLLGIETLEVRPPSTRHVHSIGEEAPKTASKPSDQLLNDNTQINATLDSVSQVDADGERRTNIGKLMSQSHCFANGKRLYHIAIIDYLQGWNCAKKAERFLKNTIMGRDGDKMSVIEPNAYAARF